MLTRENFNRGFLFDDELMAGVTESPEYPDQFLAYVLRHTTGEYLGYHPFKTLDEALTQLNQIPREWTYATAAGKCGGGNCGTGQCAGGGCGLKKAMSEKGSQDPARDCATGSCGSESSAS